MASVLKGSTNGLEGLFPPRVHPQHVAALVQRGVALAVHGKVGGGAVQNESHVHVTLHATGEKRRNGTLTKKNKPIFKNFFQKSWNLNK